MIATLGRTRRSSSIAQAVPASQEWYVVAEASSIAELQEAVPTAQSFPEGALGRVRIRGFGLGVLGDLAGAEKVWNQFFNPEGLEILGVSGEGFSTVVVDFSNPVAQAQDGYAPQRFGPVAIIAIIFAVTAALSVLGWVISKITILLFGTSSPDAGVFDITTILLVGLGVVGFMLLSQNKPRAAPS